MSEITVGIVDYGVGNHASVLNTLKHLGFRIRVSSDRDILSQTNVLILPGVGAFPVAMEALHKRQLTNFLRDEAKTGRPIIGICLGMQLLASSSSEVQFTEGLGLIPGKVIPLANNKWHIGWNEVQCSNDDKSFVESSGEDFYFNHSYRYEGPREFQTCISSYGEEFASVIRKDNIIGIQFHPEKSQIAGKNLLKKLIQDVTNA